MYDVCFLYCTAVHTRTPSNTWHPGRLAERRSTSRQPPVPRILEFQHPKKTKVRCFDVLWWTGYRAQNLIDSHGKSEVPFLFIDSSTSLSSMCCVSACRHRNAGFVLRQVQISMGSLCWTPNLGIFFQHKGCMSFSMPIACQRTNSCWFLHRFVSFCVILCLFLFLISF